MKNKVILFDFDGTIADSMETIIHILNNLAGTYRLPRIIKKEDVPHLRNISLREIISEFRVASWKIPFLIYSGRKKFSSLVSTLKPFNGIPDLLRTLHNNNFTLGIVTSNSKKNAMDFLQNNDLNFFDFIHSEFNLFGKDKVLSHILKRYNLAKDDMVYIGDETRDMEAAKKAGIKVIGVTWGSNNRKALEKYSPEFIIDDPKEILEIVKKF